jgi:hypothetical protein
MPVVSLHLPSGPLVSANGLAKWRSRFVIHFATDRVTIVAFVQKDLKNTFFFLAVVHVGFYPFFPGLIKSFSHYLCESQLSKYLQCVVHRSLELGKTLHTHVKLNADSC